MKYPIKNNEQDIQKHLIKWEKQASNHSKPKLDLIKVEHLGKSKTYVAFYRVDSTFYRAILEKGLNGRLKIISSGTKNSRLSYDGIKTNKGQYGLVIGKNLNKNIVSIKVELQNFPFDYTIKVPDDPYFLIQTKLPEEITGETYASVYALDQNNQEVPFE